MGIETRFLFWFITRPELVYVGLPMSAGNLWLDDTTTNKPTAKRQWHGGSRQITEVKHRRAELVPGWVTAWEHPVLLATLGAVDTWRSRDLRSAECASLTIRILHNSPLQSVTGVWTWVKKKRKKSGWASFYAGRLQRIFFSNFAFVDCIYFTFQFEFMLHFIRAVAICRHFVSNEQCSV